ncbi:MAG: NADP-dependent glyceraldehyde-3-phosphate dehydrogenase [Proteobacteria bacterium]|nr:NADP-dependent glyceraldehyde-3-phosphate dehydrogenase [Pseudomonadota bacterium]MBU4296621.1 NADP-dependent glyceraldehyde-3-phosphate dehydrogenase [Pseudomonadota bacterium]MCG2748250.1 NADP-dependent glyceraldehyde-3-phosphate dehydrogenase [Desulfobulbaceae bacterium]
MTDELFHSIFPRPDMVPAAYAIPLPLQQGRYLCDGEIRTWDGPHQDVLSPVCEVILDTVQPKRIGSYPLLSEEQALEALDAACRAYDHGRGAWPTMGVEDRIRHMEAFAFRMQEQRENVVKLLMWEIGKSLPDSEKEFDRTIEYIRDTIDALKDLDRVSSRFVIEQGVIGQIRRGPLGVVLCMGPFNYPLNETFTTLIPALIMGNAVIFKPPKLGVLLHQPLLEAFRDSFPRGVINTINGEGQKVIGPLMKSGRIDVLAFIGSSRVADTLKKQHPRPHRLRGVLGLEAKNAAIILQDADLDHAVRECVLGSLSYNGQRCTALKMLFVHEKIADAFIAKFSQAVDALQVGMPWDDKVQITPLPEPNKTGYLTELIDDARSKGAKVVNQKGGRVHHTIMSPAVVYPVGPGMRLYTEEQFGPVVPIAAFADIEEPMNYVTNSDYGQQVSLFGTDPEIIADLIDPLVNQVCRVNINSQCQRGPDTFPFTGRKDSAEGTLSVSDALRAFTIRTLVAAKETDANRRIIKSIITERRSRFLSTDFIF